MGPEVGGCGQSCGVLVGQGGTEGRYLSGNEHSCVAGEWLRGWVGVGGVVDVGVVVGAKTDWHWPTRSGHVVGGCGHSFGLMVGGR